MRKSANTQVPVWNRKDIKVGTKLEGYYVRDKKFESRQYGEGLMYIIADLQKVEHAVMATASVRGGMINVPLGSHVWLEYIGEEKSSNGRMVKVYNIEFDDEDKVDVHTYSANTKLEVEEKPTAGVAA